jgi:hypothetical protein
VARLKDERAALESILEELETDDSVPEGAIRNTEQWIEQLRTRLAAIDTFLKAVESGP